MGGYVPSDRLESGYSVFGAVTASAVFEAFEALETAGPIGKAGHDMFSTARRMANSTGAGVILTPSKTSPVTTAPVTPMATIVGNDNDNDDEDDDVGDGSGNGEGEGDDEEGDVGEEEEEEEDEDEEDEEDEEEEEEDGEEIEAGVGGRRSHSSLGLCRVEGENKSEPGHGEGEKSADCEEGEKKSKIGQTEDKTEEEETRADVAACGRLNVKMFDSSESTNFGQFLKTTGTLRQEPHGTRRTLQQTQTGPDGRSDKTAAFILFHLM
ncbi:unnamed protein product [Protopolystoma xenopodis]|uniref:PPIase cyclophilin-type domain-containing protein n=1 Tax=Protopolystoma xenopodis TaxID=117903 RepID=A0A448XE41_9PLAT|nr:unnamed protein product [Protopolystoma xenopodis]